MRPGMFIQSGIRGYPDRETSLKELKRILPFSVVFFRSDFTDESDLKSLVRQVNQIYKDEGVDPPVIAVDQEGGNVVRIPWIDYNPSNFFLGSVNNHRLTNLIGKITAQQLGQLGIRWNLAPVLDILNGYNQVILERSFSEELEMVATHGVEYIRGLQEGGVAATAKHFPGHGGVLEDSHLMLPKDTRGKDALLNDAYPFVKAIEAGVSTIMLSHVLYEALDPVHPASMSPHIQLLLRKQMGYHGAIITDSVDMKAVANNYTLKEIVQQSVGSETDLVECADLHSAIEMADYVKNIDPFALNSKAKRLVGIVPENILKYVPPVEVLNSYSLLSNREIRKVHLDPEKEFKIVFLDVHPESQVSEAASPFHLVAERLKELKLKFTTENIENLAKSRTDQIILVGRNEHLKDRHTTISEVCKDRKCVFISTSISKDTGIIDPDIGYIAAYSSKKENLLGAIYKSLGFL